MAEGLDEIPESLINSFREETVDLLADMEAALMQLEACPDSAEPVARAFRALHTIKGNAAMFGFEAMETLAHELEHVFDLLRKQRLAVSAEIVSLALGAKDRLHALLLPGEDTEEESAGRAGIVRRIRAVLEGSPAGPGDTPLASVPAGTGAGGDNRPDEGFLQEVSELLMDLEVALMELERNPRDHELVRRAFRALHSLKGNGARHGLAELEAFVGELESVFEGIRSTGTAVTRELIDLTLEACERMCRFIDGAASSAEEHTLRKRQIETMHRISRGTESGLGAEGTAPSTRSIWRIRFRPGPATFSAGTDPIAILDGLRALGNCAVVARFDEVPALENLEPEACHLHWEIEIETGRSLDELRDAFVFVVGPGSAVEFDPADELRSTAEARECGPSSSGPMPSREPSPAPVAGSLAGSEAGTVRVGAGRLDTLVDLVGELVTVQARLSRHADLDANPLLAGIAEEVERLTGDLRDLTLGIRMVPLRPAFGKFRRLVRDLSREMGREVEFVAAGEETELDKSVIERMGDPIVHILRNCIDHGIEPPAERERAGKPRRGRVRLGAAQEGPSVVLRVEDDGRGIDLQAVRRSAIARGLLGEHEERGERELHALLFAPGFSTSSRVTSVSGRGVGLDVVKRAVEALRGSIRLESSPGAGTTFEVRLPLTLAIIEGLAVAIGPERFIIPLAAVRECVELVRRDGAARRVCDVADVRGEALAYVRLREWLAVPGAPPQREQIVVAEAAGRSVGFVVDGVLGQHQTVIKPLGHFFRNAPGLAGSTILGDGTVALILDLEQLLLAVQSAGDVGAVRGEVVRCAR